MADNETIADIIAEMRRGTKLPGYWRSCDVNKILQYHAERIEAAIKRERGDAAKLREALETARLFVTNCPTPLTTPLLGCGMSRAEVINIIDAALAAPPRNCDKYATADEALKAQEQMFNDSNFANGECKLGCPECDNPRVGCKIAWLYAPATEQEGGGK